MELAALREILLYVKYIQTGSAGVIILLVILTIVVLAKRSSPKEYLRSKIDQQQKIINELQNITSRQQEFIDKIKDTNEILFKQTQLLMSIQKQTRTESQEEKEEIKRKIEELNKMMKI